MGWGVVRAPPTDLERPGIPGIGAVLAAVPSRLALNSAGGAPSAPVRFLARSRGATTRVKAVVEGDDNRLVVEADARARDGPFTGFRVVVSPEAGGSGSLAVPVVVRKKGEG